MYFRSGQRVWSGERERFTICKVTSLEQYLNVVITRLKKHAFIEDLNQIFFIIAFLDAKVHLNPPPKKGKVPTTFLIC